MTNSAICRLRTVRLRVLVVATALSLAPFAHAADSAETEVEKSLERQQQMIEQSQKKLDQSIRKDEQERQRLMAKQRRQLERDALRTTRRP